MEGFSRFSFADDTTPEASLLDKAHGELTAQMPSSIEPGLLIEAPRKGRKPGSGRKPKEPVEEPALTPQERAERVDAFLDADILKALHTWLLKAVAHKIVHVKKWEPPEECTDALGKGANAIVKKRVPDSWLRAGEEIEYGLAFASAIASMLFARAEERREEALEKQDRSGVREQGPWQDNAGKAVYTPPVR